MRESVFHKDKLIEAKSWLIGITNLLGMKTPEWSNEVANYEVGKATSYQLAISMLSNSPACKSSDDEAATLHKPAEHYRLHGTESDDDRRRKADDDDD